MENTPRLYDIDSGIAPVSARVGRRAYVNAGLDDNGIADGREDQLDSVGAAGAQSVSVCAAYGAAFCLLVGQ